MMAGYATMKLSSKGQVVIPEEVRNDLGLSEGDQFVVIGQGDAVILKVITPPKLEEFQGPLGQARAEAKKAGIQKADLKFAIAKVRRRSKGRSRRSSIPISLFPESSGRVRRLRFGRLGRDGASSLPFPCS
jgi:AbrB family looped-hinge helix DNA binding protein